MPCQGRVAGAGRGTPLKQGSALGTGGSPAIAAAMGYWHDHKHVAAPCRISPVAAQNASCRTLTL